MPYQPSAQATPVEVSVASGSALNFGGVAPAPAPVPAYALSGPGTAVAGTAQSYTVTGSNLAAGQTYTGSLVSGDLGMVDTPATFSVTAASPSAAISVLFAAVGAQSLKAVMASGAESNQLSVAVSPAPAPPPPPPPPPPSAPSITQQPLGGTHPQGTAVTLTVVAVGAAPLSYQWRKGGVAISGATSASYTTPLLTLLDNGASFDVVVSNGNGSVTSAAAVLQVQGNVWPSNVGILAARGGYGANGTTKMVTFTRDLNDQRYNRYQIHCCYDAVDSNTHTVRIGAQFGGGANRALSGTNYTLLIRDIDLNLVRSVSGTATPGVTQVLDFTLSIVGLPQGWYWQDVQSDDPTETVYPWPCFIKQELTPKISANPSRMPVYTEHHEVDFNGQQFKLARVPVPAMPWSPTLIPLPPRTIVEGPAQQHTRQTIFVAPMIPKSSDDTIRRPCITAKGVITTENQHSYHYHHQRARVPITPLLDGPRGQAAQGMLLHIQPAEAAPDGVRRRTAYALTGWSLIKIWPDGYVQTLAGLRYKDMMPYWEDVPASIDAAVAPSPSNAPGTLELVGDWSAVPAGTRAMWNPWGFCWDPRTTGIDTNLPTIEGEHPHPTSVVGYVADTLHNRILKLTFNGQDRSAECQVSVLIQFGTVGGLNMEPWDIVYDAARDRIYVSLRRTHQVNAYNPTTGAFIETIVQGSGLGYVLPEDKLGRLNPGVTLEQARADVAVVPEGIVLQDDVLYWGSYAALCIKKINLTTRVVSMHTSDWTKASGESYVKLAIDDGTFMPRGTIYHASWWQIFGGWPRVYAPDGTRLTEPFRDPYESRIYGRIDGVLGGIGNYNSAVGAGHGRVLVSSSGEGLMEVTAEQVSDPPAVSNTLVQQGRNAMRDGLELMYQTFGHYGLAPPWGLSHGVDEYLIMRGHPVPPTEVVEQPQSVTAIVNDSVSFSCRGYGSKITYQAQRSNDGGATWANVGATSTVPPTYSVVAVGALDNGARFRFQLTSPAGNVTSAEAVLTVNF